MTEGRGQKSEDKGKKVRCWEGERNEQSELELQFTFSLFST